MSLEQVQQGMLRALEHGPGHVDAAAFVGPAERVLVGFAVHANTISHARLVALEDTFPRSREALGADRFNALSRQFTALPQSRCEPLATIGRKFPAYLHQLGEAQIAGLARFEWDWLESCHAAEAPALALSDLSGIAEADLLDLRVARHPAARLSGPVTEARFAAEHPGPAGAAAILITRPEAEVRLFPASRAIVRRFALLEKVRPVCNLLATGDETDDEDGFEALLAMIEAGSLVLTHRPGG